MIKRGEQQGDNMTKSLNTVIGKRYKYLLADCTAIAAHLGISYQAVYYLLRGQHSLSLDRFIKICKFAKLNPAKELKHIYKEMEQTDEKIN